MSLATFKRKSINSASSATKISGKKTAEYWIYQGPLGGNKNNLPSTIFRESLVGPDGMVGGNMYNASNAGFSITGPHRNRGAVGGDMRMSKSATPYRGTNPVGWGGTRGRYPDGPNNVSLNIMPVATGVAVQNGMVKPPVLSNKGMLERRYRWIHNGQYPNYWVQPIYTGNQTETASQGLYIHKKSAANYCWFDVNDSANYVDYYRECGTQCCQRTPGRGYIMAIQQQIAPYTKTLHQPQDQSSYILRIQRRCANPLPRQKPFPYAVQTGTGVLRGGTHVDNVASSCGISKPVTVPPDWYVEPYSLERMHWMEEQRGKLKEVLVELQTRVYEDVFLKGTTN